MRSFQSIDGMLESNMAKVVARVKMPITLTKTEKDFLVALSRRSNMTPSQLVTSVMRRHIKSRYRIPRKEWYYVFGE